MLSLDKIICIRPVNVQVFNVFSFLHSPMVLRQFGCARSVRARDNRPEKKQATLYTAASAGIDETTTCSMLKSR